MASVNLISKIATSVKQWLANNAGEGEAFLPKEGDAGVANSVTAIWKESLNWRRNTFEDRFSTDYTRRDPVEVFKDFRKLEQGLHWDVFGRRNTEPGKDYQHEIVDDEIGNQIRVRKAHLTAQWHDLQVAPNIQNISQILDQERQATGWSDTITMGVHRGLTEGQSVFMSFLDKTKNRDGVAREMLVDNAGIFPTPFATSFEQIDGCWYVIYAAREQKRFVENEYPELKGKLPTSDMKLSSDITTDKEKHGYGYQYNATVDKLLCFFDDDTLVEIELEEDELHKEHALIHQGQMPPVEYDQNHKEHLRGHMEWIDEVNKSIPHDLRTPAEDKFLKSVTELALMHVEKHIDIGNKKKNEDGIPIGKKKKYPFGRKIVVVGELVAEDIPNPYEIDWRELFTKWEAEKLPENFYGRGMAEVLWRTNQGLDTMLSRTADISLTVGQPKPWLHETDKEVIDENPLNNDSTEPAYYRVNPPQFAQGQAPKENLEVFSILKQNAKNQHGVNDTAYGMSPQKRASGAMVESLQKQGNYLITGEANQRLNECVEKLMRTRLMIMKKFYTEPRQYYINGQWKSLVMSRILSTYKVKNEKGQMEERDIPMFQVTVKPGSNLANQWETDFQFAVQLYSMKKPDGTPLIPPEAILDHLEQRYPQYGRTGDYYQLGEAMKIGLQVLSQQNAKKQEDMKTLKAVRASYKKKGIQAAVEHGARPGNGQPAGGVNVS